MLLRLARVTAISLVVKGAGFLVPLAIAAFFGAGPHTDAYFLAYSAILLCGIGVSRALEVSVVSYAARAAKLGRATGLRFAHKYAARALLWGALAGVAGLLVIGLGLWLAPTQNLDSAWIFLYYGLLLPAAPAAAIAGVYTGSLHAAFKLERGVFGTGFRGAGALLGAMAASLAGDLWPVALGLSAGEIVRALWTRAQLRRAFAALPDAAEAPLPSGFSNTAAYQVGAQGVLALSPLVEKFLLAGVAVAAISHVEYAFRLISVGLVLFDGGIGVYLLARWSNLRADNALRPTWRAVYRPLALIAMGAVVAGALVVITAPWVVDLVLHHGAFTQSDAESVTGLLRWFGAALPFSLVAYSVERLIIADSRTPLFLKLSVVRASLKLGLLAALLPSQGILSVPMAFAGSELGYMSLCLYLTRQKAWEAP